MRDLQQQDLAQDPVDAAEEDKAVEASSNALRAELQQAVIEYQEQLRSIDDMLQGNADHADLLQIRQELLEALALTQEACSSSALYSTPAATSTSSAGAPVPVSHSTLHGQHAQQALHAQQGQHMLHGQYAQHGQHGGSMPPPPRKAPSSKTKGAPPPPKWQSCDDSSESNIMPENGTPLKGKRPRDREVKADTCVLPSAVALHSSRGRNNPRMHPENLYYAKEPDFAALAEYHSPLKQYIGHTAGGKVSIDFTSWEATRELTRALLSKDFGIEWDLPEGQLIPTITNRCNYIHWLNDLVMLSSPPGGGPVRGVDIGCGCNYIYCLLGAAIYGWEMVGTDVTPVAEKWALSNLEKNPKLARLLSFRHVPQAAREQEGSVLLPAVRGNEVFHFCMCNPPFFESAHVANLNPNTACGGTTEEMVFPGGEFAFILRMMHDSWQLKEQVHWYSSMVGHKDTLKAVRKVLYSLPGVTGLRTTEFAQGKTSRWAIAWSFAASPNTQNQPIGAAARAAAARLPATGNKVERQVSFSVQASHNNGSLFIQDLAGHLTNLGAQTKVDLGMFSIQAIVPAHATQDLKYELDTGAGQTCGQTHLQGGQLSHTIGQIHTHGGPSDVQAGRPGLTLFPPVPSMESAGPASASHCTEAHGGQQQRGGAVGVGQKRPLPAGPHPNDLKVRISVYQQQRGRFDVMASLPNDANYRQASDFVWLMRYLQQQMMVGG